MLFKITFKDPNAFDIKDFSSDEDRDIIEILINKFVKYDEFITIEFDTERYSAKVCEV